MPIGYQTPNAAVGFASRSLLIPGGEIWLANVFGALLELTAEEQFVAFGDQTAEETAAQYAAMLDAVLCDHSAFYSARVLSVRPASHVAYWPLSERAVMPVWNYLDVAANGVLVNGTRGLPGIGDGNFAYQFNGTNSVLNFYSAAFASAFNGAAGTLALWFRFDPAAIFPPIATKSLLWLGSSFGNRVTLLVDTAGRLAFYYIAGNILKSVVSAVLTAGAWYLAMLTYDGVANQMRAFLQGAQVGATQVALGTWLGAPVSTMCAVGATSPTGPAWFPGSVAHLSVWNAALTPAEVASLYPVLY